MWLRRTELADPPDLETVRKRARLLVIDDHVFPAQETFTRDGYHFERWPRIKNLSQLTDGHYDLILLDLQGVGLDESPDMQGLGILRHVKKTNPAQIVVAYSAQPQALSSSDYLRLADSVLDKGTSYVNFKETVDDLLLRHANPAYFVSAMNRELGEDAVLVPKAVSKALRAFRRQRVGILSGYLEKNLNDRTEIDTIVKIVATGIKVVSLLA